MLSLEGNHVALGGGTWDESKGDCRQIKKAWQLACEAGVVHLCSHLGEGRWSAVAEPSMAAWLKS